MATTAEIEKIMREVAGLHFGEMFKAFSDTAAGIGAALRILYEQGGSLTSGKLCERMGVSSARVAVLLKTMASKGLIRKEKNVLDARVTMVFLTPFGEQTIREMREACAQQIGRLIDKVGFERLEAFLRMAKEIKDSIDPPKVAF